METGIAAWTDLGRIDHQIAILKLRVTQAITKWVERTGGHVHIPMVPAPSLLNPKDLRGLAVIVGRQLGSTARNGNRQPAAWIVIAKKYIGDGSAAEFTWFPRFYQRGDMRGFPTHGERPAID